MLRRGYEAYNRGDAEGTVADFAPTFGVRLYRCDSWHGGCPPRPGGIPGVHTLALDEFEDARIEGHELIEAGDQVLPR